MIFKFVYKVAGGHTHVAVFAGKAAASLGKCGQLTFRNEEWEVFKQMERSVGSVFGIWHDAIFEEQIESKR